MEKPRQIVHMCMGQTSRSSMHLLEALSSHKDSDFSGNEDMLVGRDPGVGPLTVGIDGCRHHMK